MSTDFVDIATLMNIEGLPGVTDQNGNELVPFEMPDIKEVTSNPTNRTVDLESDYSSVRDNVYFQQQLLRLMAMRAYENAATSDSPRHVEVFATLMTQMTNNNKQILDIQKLMKDITQEEVKTGTPAPNITTTGPVFIGSPTEIMRELGGQQDVRAKKAREIEGECSEV